MQRYNSAAALLHNHTYTYNHATNGNVPTAISGGATNFQYNANGNMTLDGLTNTQIEYNIINLPQRIFGSSGEVQYIYAANGEKLASVVGSSFTYYRNVMVYSGSAVQPDYMLHPEGLVVKEGAAWVYKYHKTDHVGNTRGLLAVRSNVLQNESQNTDYYPFGLAHQLSNLHLNKYLFGGKEYQDATINGSPLGVYDFHARFYNPTLGRWFMQDPTQQFANPYLYGANNPVNFVDPDGEIAWFVVPLIAAAVFATGNTVAHAVRGDIDNFGDGLKYFAQGAVTGFALGCAWQFAPLIPWAGRAIQAGMTYYAYGQTAVGILGMVGGAINDGGDGLGRAGKLFLGNFYLDENNWLGGVWHGFTRHTWEVINTFLGHSYSHIRNSFSLTDHVEYWGGATFSIRENAPDGWRGVSLGNYINVKLYGEFDRDHEGSWVYGENGLYLHEYGHIKDSRLLGPFYIPVIGIPSASGAEWTEIRANNNVWNYLRKRRLLDSWDIYEHRFPLR